MADHIPIDLVLKSFTVPIETRVCGVVLSNEHRLPFEGKGEMLVSQEGLAISIQRGFIIKKQTFFGTDWNGIHELKNKLRSNKSFALTFLHEGRDLSINVKIRSSQYIDVANILEKLPSSSVLPVCVVCGGTLIDGTCRNCRANNDVIQRKRFLLGVCVFIISPLIGITSILLWSVTPIPFFFLGLWAWGLWLIIHARHRLRIQKKADSNK